MIRLFEEFLLLTEAANKLKLNLPPDILQIKDVFTKNGHSLYVVGGAVRDAILGKKPKDFDLATDAKPDEVLKMAKAAGLPTIEVGKSFGVVIINGNEIATFREDIGKGRRPDAVNFTDIKTDVKRRDLTVNALFYDIDLEEIVDLIGGIEDLKNKQIKTVGNAAERFNEDPLRKLRALRFAGSLGGEIHSDTLQALKDDVSLDGVSSERIRDEFLKSLSKAKSIKKYLKLTYDLGYLNLIFPGLTLNTKFIENKDPMVIIAELLSKNKPDKVENVLKKGSYTVKEINDILFLLHFMNFNPKDVYLFKKEQERTDLNTKSIIDFANLHGKAKDALKFVSFNLSFGGKDVDPNLKGKEIGDKIKELETKKFLNESKSNYSLSIKHIEDNAYEVSVIKGKETIGSLHFIKSKYKSVLKATHVVVDPNYRHQGIASSMYEFAEKEFNMKFVKTDDVLTADGKALWNNPNRKFGL